MWEMRVLNLIPMPGSVYQLKQELKITSCPLVFIASLPGGFWRSEERGSSRR